MSLQGCKRSKITPTLTLFHPGSGLLECSLLMVLQGHAHVTVTAAPPPFWSYSKYTFVRARTFCNKDNAYLCRNRLSRTGTPNWKKHPQEALSIANFIISAHMQSACPWFCFLSQIYNKYICMRDTLQNKRVKGKYFSYLGKDEETIMVI